MPVQSYRMKPVIKDAIRLVPENAQEIMNWISSNGGAAVFEWGSITPMRLTVQTHMGDMDAYAGDWIVRGLEGEFYPVQDSKFQVTYELLEPLSVREAQHELA